MRAIQFLILFLIVSSSAFAGLVIVPGAGELGAFSAEWCAANTLGGEIKRVCVGEVRFHGQRVRAFALKGAGEALYIDSEFRGVELWRPSFSLIGPVTGAKTMETGQAALKFDDRGEAIAVRLEIPSLGRIIVFRQ